MTEEPENNIPNFDCFIDENDIQKWLDEHQPVTTNIARQVFPHQPVGYVKTTKVLCEYAAHKITAMKFRKEGKMQAALLSEEECDRIYDSLPQFAKW